VREYSISPRSSIIITLFVLWLLSERLGSGFSMATLTLGALSFQTIVPNWAAWLGLGVGILWVQRHRDLLAPVEEWIHAVLVGEEDK